MKFANLVVILDLFLTNTTASSIIKQIKYHVKTPFQINNPCYFNCLRISGSKGKSPHFSSNTKANLSEVTFMISGGIEVT